MAKILLVEDNPAAVKRIKQFISKIDTIHVISVCSEANIAYSLSQQEKFDLFILDIQLSDYKGTSLAKQLRNLPEYKYTPIIFETALAGEELTAYRDVKCYSFLIKPYSETEFQTAFCDALGLSSKLLQEEKHIQIEQKQFILDYNVSEIAYIEAFGKKVIVHINSRILGIKEDTISGYTLGRMASLIDEPSFVQCHKSYIINTAHIEKIDKTERFIFLKGFAEKIPVGNKFQSALW